MIFSFFRHIRRTICFCIVIIALVVILKYEFPEVGRQIGRWISGFESSGIAQAFSSMLTNMENGNGFMNSIEVFHEQIETETAN